MSTDLITEIQAAPREFAAKLETMRAALAAVTARLEERDAELSELRAAVQRDILSRLGATASQFAALTAERDAARAEVARLTAALESIEFIDYGNGLVVCPRCGFRRIMGHGAGCSLSAALRGDTAPATGRE